MNFRKFDLYELVSSVAVRFCTVEGRRLCGWEMAKIAKPIKRGAIAVSVPVKFIELRGTVSQ